MVCLYETSVGATMGGMGWREGGTGPRQTQSGRQTQTDENKQLHPTVQEESRPGILEKCQAKHTSVEARQTCQGALMQHA